MKRIRIDFACVRSYEKLRARVEQLAMQHPARKNHHNVEKMQEFEDQKEGKEAEEREAGVIVRDGNKQGMFKMAINISAAMSPHDFTLVTKEPC